MAVGAGLAWRGAIDGAFVAETRETPPGLSRRPEAGVHRTL